MRLEEDFGGRLSALLAGDEEYQRLEAEHLAGLRQLPQGEGEAPSRRGS